MSAFLTNICMKGSEAYKLTSNTAQDARFSATGSIVWKRDDVREGSRMVLANTPCEWGLHKPHSRERWNDISRWSFSHPTHRSRLARCLWVLSSGYFEQFSLKKWSRIPVLVKTMRQYRYIVDPIWKLSEKILENVASWRQNRKIKKTIEEKKWLQACWVQFCEMRQFLPLDHVIITLRMPIFRFCDLTSPEVWHSSFSGG